MNDSKPRPPWQGPGKVEHTPLGSSPAIVAGLFAVGPGTTR